MNPSNTSEDSQTISLSRFRTGTWSSDSLVRPILSKSKFDAPTSLPPPREPISSSNENFTIVSTDPSCFYVFHAYGVELLHMSAFLNKREMFLLSDLFITNCLKTTYMIALTSTKNFIFFRLAIEDQRVEAIRLSIRLGKESERNGFCEKGRRVFYFDQNSVKFFVLKEFDKKKSDNIDAKSLFVAEEEILKMCVSPHRNVIYIFAEKKIVGYSFEGEKICEFAHDIADEPLCFESVANGQGETLLLATSSKFYVVRDPLKGEILSSDLLPSGGSLGSKGKISISRTGRLICVLDPETKSIICRQIDIFGAEVLLPERRASLPADSTLATAAFIDGSELLAVNVLSPGNNETFLVPLGNIFGLSFLPPPDRPEDSNREIDFDNLELKKKNQNEISAPLNLAELENNLLPKSDAARPSDEAEPRETDKKAESKKTGSSKKNNEGELREAQAKALTEVLSNFHEGLMKKLNGVFEESRTNMSKELEQSIINQYKLQEQNLLEKFSKKTRETFVPQVQATYESIMANFGKGLEKSVNAYVGRANAEREAVDRFAKELRTGLSSNLEAVKTLESSLGRFFAEDGLLTQARASPSDPSENPETLALLEKIAAQQTLIAETASSLNSRIKALEKRAETPAALPQAFFPPPNYPAPPSPPASHPPYYVNPSMLPYILPQYQVPQYVQAVPSQRLSQPQPTIELARKSSSNYSLQDHPPAPMYMAPGPIYAHEQFYPPRPPTAMYPPTQRTPSGHDEADKRPLYSPQHPESDHVQPRLSVGEFQKL